MSGLEKKNTRYFSVLAWDCLAGAVFKSAASKPQRLNKEQKVGRAAAG
jgi:hypothetical protein